MFAMVFGTIAVVKSRLQGIKRENQRKSEWERGAETRLARVILTAWPIRSVETYDPDYFQNVSNFPAPPLTTRRRRPLGVEPVADRFPPAPPLKKRRRRPR